MAAPVKQFLKSIQNRIICVGKGKIVNIGNGIRIQSENDSSYIDTDNLVIQLNTINPGVPIELRTQGFGSDINLTPTQGNVNINPQVNGDVNITPSGGVNIRPVNGGVDITPQGNGDVNLQTTNGYVNIIPSRGVNIRPINEGVNIAPQGNGFVNITTVTGHINIAPQANGDVNITPIDGNVNIDTQGNGNVNIIPSNGIVNIKPVIGIVDIQPVAGAVIINAHGIGAGVNIISDQSSILLNAAGGFVSITSASGYGVNVQNNSFGALGFFNTAPVVKQAAIPDAVDLATAISSLNSLLAAMRNYGLISL